MNYKTNIAAVLLIAAVFANNNSLTAQKTTVLQDTTGHKYLPEITVVGRNSKSDIHQLPEVTGTSINAGKKNSLIVMDNVNGNVVTNNMRQVLAKVPGIQVWESEGSGVQIGIAARGLSPNRSWEFNIRQNGYDIAADPFGYPEAYYNPQLQAVQRIEIVRGQASLQYGPQFGGMVNYILRNGSEMNKPFQFESQQTVGTYGLFNSYNAVGGTTQKFHYYAFADHRNADGWRKNNRYYTNNGFGTFTYKLSKKLAVTAEVMHAQQRNQQPGGLTDAQFKEDAQQSLRSRNWFDIKWTTAALIANYAISEKSKLNVKLFTMAGNRNSVGYLRAITIGDTINAATIQYNNRTLDVDQYRNTGFEARYITGYHIGNISSTFAGGVRLYKGQTHRYRDGVATTGSEYTNELVNPVWPRDILYKSSNAAVFAENVFTFGKLLLIPGVRYEYVEGKASGRNGYASNGDPILLQNQKRSRGFLLAGFAAEYHTTNKTEIYVNITQAYRPMQFSDLTAPPTTDVIDTDLKDAKGYNFDLGYRGKVSDYLFFDASVFYLQYNNRIGTITHQRTDGSFYNYRTNVGNSSSKGVEALAELSFVKAFTTGAKNYDVSAFVSYSHINARYGDFKVIARDGNNLKETNLKNKRVENAPENIIRTGVTFSYKDFSLTTQVSHTSDAFADANNTVEPSANGQNGLIPAYTITDITAVYKWKKNYNIRVGVNNLTNEKYFTRRGGGYPGPGLLPAEARTAFVSFGISL